MSALSATRPRLLMCRPDHFAVSYVINPWMEGNQGKAAPARAMEQWEALHGLLSEVAEVELVTPQAGWPDMTFTANAGLVWGKTVLLSRFLHDERRGEEAYFRDWFEKHDFEVHQTPHGAPFEGAGDALPDTANPWLWAGYGWRTELAAHPFLAHHLPLEVLSLRLVDRRFYHLDTCFCPLSEGRIIYFPAAFDERSRRLIESRVPPENRIAVSEADAAQFACNAVVVGSKVFLNHAGQRLRKQLAAFGLEAIVTPLDEFLKAGGAAKCLTLHLAPAASAKEARPGRSAVTSRVFQMAGHLLDSGLLGQALDRTVEGGGSFRVLDFDLGRARYNPSQAHLQVWAPDEATLESITARLLVLGAQPEHEDDAQTQIVIQDGVAPDGFYATTIYPTEVKIAGTWQRVQQQRMDGVIAIPQGETPALPLCKLLRDLQCGEQVICGTRGVRTVRDVAGRPAQSRETSEDGEDFSFMSGNASSERRVEQVARRLAWQMRRVRERSGKCVIVAGPVVIHTGGGAHLAALVRAGFVQALLGGNAIAVHDIEEALYGTSLGVDTAGLGVVGGHLHHLRAINTIRKCGSIAAAVEQGVLQSGVLYECVRHGVPFALAGSIRDDGPLPDTQMDLIAAQRRYAELLRGAELIVMLSTMLHSIGAGNMTPAGVPMYCVDINPAVVTKLSDRGSLEATGVVTDVGLFLGLLRRELEV